jgi:hypothetical protein
MAKILTAILSITFIVVLFLGQSHWKVQTGAAVNTKPTSSPNQTSTPKDDKQSDAEDRIEEQLLSFTSNWPTTSIDRFRQTLKENKPFKILFVGSPSIGSESDGTFPLIKENLIETFGEKNIEVTIKTFNLTSTQFIQGNNQEEIAAEQADLIVMEPFILQNNGIVLIEDTKQDTTKIIADIKETNPKTAFILQPSYPLYQATIYPRQVDALKTYAEENEISYLDHWTSWPDAKTESFKEYLSPDQSGPSEKGNQVWSEYIVNYLISK